MNSSATSAALIPEPERERSASSSSPIAARSSSMKSASCRWPSRASCLRVLEERRFERVGGTQEIEVSVRIVTATNKDLRAAVADKTFREDLYFRIAAVPITIPPLRDRGDDVLLLAEHFLDRFKREFRKPSLALTDDARERLRTYAWPGNVRELQNAIERAAILGKRLGNRYRCIAPARRQARARRIARWNARRAISVGRAARGSVAARRQRTSSDSRYRTPCANRSGTRRAPRKGSASPTKRF